MIKTTVCFAAITVVYAALQSSAHLPPLDDASPSSNLDFQSLSDSSSFGDSGYHYKTVKRLLLRHRRAAIQLSLNSYSPSAASEPAVADIPVFVDVPAIAEQGSAVLADDGYHYNTIKRIRYRHRRDINRQF